MNMLWLWGGVAVVTLVAEIATTALVSIWFTIGAVGALIAAAAGVSPLAQLLIFLLLSIVSLLLIRPLTRRLVGTRVIPTNADRLLGMEAKVTEGIDNDNAAGAVYVDGKTWTARSANGNPIPTGELVEVAAIEAKLPFVPADIIHQLLLDLFVVLHDCNADHAVSFPLPEICGICREIAGYREFFRYIFIITPRTRQRKQPRTVKFFCAGLRRGI